MPLPGAIPGQRQHFGESLFQGGVELAGCKGGMRAKAAREIVCGIPCKQMSQAPNEPGTHGVWHQMCLAPLMSGTRGARHRQQQNSPPKPAFLR